MKTYAHIWSYLAEFLLESEMCQTKCVEKIKTHKSNVMCTHIVYTLHLIYSTHHEDDAPKKNQKNTFYTQNFSPKILPFMR